MDRNKQRGKEGFLIFTQEGSPSTEEPWAETAHSGFGLYKPEVGKEEGGASYLLTTGNHFIKSSPVCRAAQGSLLCWLPLPHTPWEAQLISESLLSRVVVPSSVLDMCPHNPSAQQPRCNSPQVIF